MGKNVADTIKYMVKGKHLPISEKYDAERLVNGENNSRIRRWEQNSDKTRVCEVGL
jgi:hypothetical protein